MDYTENVRCRSTVADYSISSYPVFQNTISHTELFYLFQPQLSMPDVILWMISNKKRVAYRRIPAHHVLFSENEKACGKFCGKTIELRLKVSNNNHTDC